MITKVSKEHTITIFRTYVISTLKMVVDHHHRRVNIKTLKYALRFTRWISVIHTQLSGIYSDLNIESVDFC